MIYAGVGVGKHADSPYQAGYEAGKNAVARMGGGDPDFMIAFISVNFDQSEVVRSIREAGKGSLFVGCSDAGEITNDGPTRKSVAVMAIRSDSVKFYTGLGRDIKNGARAAGAAVAREVKGKAGDGMRAFIMLPDVLSGNGAEIVRGVLDVLGPHFPVVGGAAGDDFLFEKTYQYRDEEVVSGAVAGVGISGS